MHEKEPVPPKLSTKKLGDKFELSVRQVLQHIYPHLEISAFDQRKPGKQTMTGKAASLDCDIVGYKQNGKPVIFSCRYKGKNNRLKPSDVGDLLLEVTDNGADGYLVSNVDPSENVEHMADYHVCGTITLLASEDENQWKAHVRGLLQTIKQVSFCKFQRFNILV